MATNILDYLNYVSSEHRVQPKFISFVSSFLQKLIDIEDVNFETAFDLDTATGNQLDTIGAMLGRSRVLPYQPVTGSPTLDDTKYRLVLRAKILQNQWDGTIEQALTNWRVIFPSILAVINDQQNMSMNVTVLGLSDSFDRELVQNGYIIPKPEGVGVGYTFATQYIFGYGPETTLIKGYGQGEWI